MLGFYWRMHSGFIAHAYVVGSLIIPTMATSAQDLPAIELANAHRGIRLGVATPPSLQVAAAQRTFTANFAIAESPISGNSGWQHLGKSWTSVRTFDNRAIGTQTGFGGYDDSYAFLTGFGPDQTAQATIWVDPAAKGDYREVEILLRWADSPTTARGYECNLAWNGAYAQIVRWNGPFGDFTYVTSRTSFEPGITPPKTGDVLTATIRGSEIRVYLNKNDNTGDHLILSGHDSTFSDGNPGIGFYVQGNRNPAQYGFTSYVASSD
jgi:hypothetical protein